MVTGRNPVHQGISGSARGFFTFSVPELGILVGTGLVAWLLINPALVVAVVVGTWAVLMFARRRSHGRPDYIEIALRRNQRVRRYCLCDRDDQWRPFVVD